MDPRVFRSVEDIAAAIGETMGPSEWLLVEQQRIDAFADVTGDHQWIHVDPGRASLGPFGRTIAHGYLTLSLLPMLASQVLAFDTGRPALNYGSNKVRYPSPVPVDSHIRLSATITRVEPVAMGSQVTVTYVIEVEGQEKPACVAEAVVLLL